MENKNIVAALEKLEKVMGRFNGEGETVEIYCDEKLIAESIAGHTADYMQGRIIKGEELKGVK
ncbi:hypothetical protein ER45_029330 (plasmid) [Bacillus mycoides]|nr:hypothetical protein ER45_029330 [Bacillus mycoides]